MKADPKLGEAIAGALRRVITLHEGSKARRAAAKRWCYEKIYDIFDGHSECSGKWRWKLEKLAARYMLPIDVTLNATRVAPDASMLIHLEDAYRETIAVREAFINGHDVADELDIRPAKRRFGKLLDRAEEAIEEMEAYARQVEDQGEGNWLAEMM